MRKLCNIIDHQVSCHKNIAQLQKYVLNASSSLVHSVNRNSMNEGFQLETIMSIIIPEITHYNSPCASCYLQQFQILIRKFQKLSTIEPGSWQLFLSGQHKQSSLDPCSKHRDPWHCELSDRETLVPCLSPGNV